LDASEIAAQNFPQRSNKQRLPQARHAFDKHVPAREQRDEGSFDQFILPDKNLGDFLADPNVQLASLCFFPNTALVNRRLGRR
jgi:hypothetical protein